MAEITMTATAMASKAVMDSSILGVRGEKLGKIDISNVIFYTEELGGVRLGRSTADDGRRQREARGKRHGGTVIE